MALNSCVERKGERKEEKEGRREADSSFAGGIVSYIKPKLSKDAQVPLQMVSFLSGEVCEQGQWAPG